MESIIECQFKDIPNGIINEGTSYSNETILSTTKNSY